MKDLTEAATFDAPITVPEGDDFMDTLAEDIERPIQKLANRTRALKAVTDHAARTDTANDFQGAVTISRADITQAALTFNHGPHDDPAHPTGNKWNRLIDAKLLLAGAHVYTGDNTYGQLAFTVNAFWDVSSGVWRRDDTTLPSYIFYLDNNGRWVCQAKTVGTTWTSWDSGEFLVATLTATTVNANSVDASAIQVDGEVNYTTPLPRAYRANMSAAGWPAWRDASNGHVFFVPEAVDTYSEIAFPLYLPRDAVLTSVTVQHNQATTARDRFTLRCRNGVIGAILYEEVAHADATNSLGTRGTTITFAPRTVHAAEDWSVVWKLNGVADPAAIGGNCVWGIEYTFTAPGPRG
jgi:hypothetical protein